MTNTILNAPHLLEPCPFCGDTPELPSGDGTQYEIECSGCGQAMAGVQICDLMTFEERAADTLTDYRYGEEFVERAKAEAIERWNTRAPSPAGVAGLEAVGYVSQDDIKWQGDCTLRLKPYSDYTIPLCRLSDAQAIIDGLRGEVEDLQMELSDTEERRASAAKNSSAFEDRMGDYQVQNGKLQDQLHTAQLKAGRYADQRDQQAQRIGELEGLLYEASGELRTDRHHGLRPRIAAALSAGKEGE